MFDMEEGEAFGAEGSSSWFDSLVAGTESLFSGGGGDQALDAGGLGGLGGLMTGLGGDFGGLAPDAGFDAMAPDLAAVNAMLASGPSMGGSFADAASGFDLSAFGVE